MTFWLPPASSSLQMSLVRAWPGACVATEWATSCPHALMPQEAAPAHKAFKRYEPGFVQVDVK